MQQVVTQKLIYEKANKRYGWSSRFICTMTDSCVLNLVHKCLPYVGCRL